MSKPYSPLHYSHVGSRYNPGATADLEAFLQAARARLVSLGSVDLIVEPGDATRYTFAIKQLPRELEHSYAVTMAPYACGEKREGTVLIPYWVPHSHNGFAPEESECCPGFKEIGNACTKGVFRDLFSALLCGTKIGTHYDRWAA
jgi:hypothetical protein